jgi:hypothetical protein
MTPGNPPSWAQLSGDTNLVHDNRERITTCRKSADKTKKGARCTISVQPPPGGKHLVVPPSPGEEDLDSGLARC